MDNAKILLMIPMYNCQKQIVRVLKQLKNKEISKYIDEVIILNNCSQDDGEAVVVEFLRNDPIDLKIKLFRNHKNYNYGGSVKVGFQYAISNNFDYVIIFHGDDQGNIENLRPYLNSREYQNYDCFLGARFMKGSVLTDYSLFRVIGNKISNAVFSICLRKKVYDLGSGLNVYKVDSLKNKFYVTLHDGMTFHISMLMAAYYYGLKVKFFPIEWKESDQISNAKLIKQSVVMCRSLFGYMVNKSGFAEKKKWNSYSKYETSLIYETGCGE